MGNEPHAGDALAPGGGGEPAVHIAVLVHMGVVQAQLRQLLGQSGPQDLLLGGGGGGSGVHGGLGVVAHVPQKAVDCVHNKTSFPLTG